MAVFHQSVTIANGGTESSHANITRPNVGVYIPTMTAGAVTLEVCIGDVNTSADWKSVYLSDGDGDTAFTVAASGHDDLYMDLTAALRGWRGPIRFVSAGAQGAARTLIVSQK